VETNIALIIVFNHRYDQNIEKLEFIYAARFTNIYYLIPFYDGDNPRVIPVYENSYYYQGYFAQGYKTYFEERYSHYLFVADDLVLNPLINENNFRQHFRLTQDACFIPELLSLHNIPDSLNTQYGFNFNMSKSWGVEGTNEIPGYEEAVENFKKFGLDIKPLAYHQAYGRESRFKTFKRLVKQLAGGEKTLKKHYDLSYPLVNAFSDLLLVSKKSLKKFTHYCGVFAAANLFVELAIPTSLIFSADAIITEKDLALNGKFLHTELELKELDPYEYNLAALLNNFPHNYLYLHPVKISKWNI